MVLTPTSGVTFTNEEIQQALSSLNPALELLTCESTTLGYNNHVYFVTTVCGRDLVLKVGGRYWKRQKTEAEVAGLLALDRTSRGTILVPRVVGFDSHPTRDSKRLPWEWVLLERLPGIPLKEAWHALDEGQKEDVAKKLADIVVRIQSITHAIVDSADTQPMNGNLSLTRPMDDITSSGHDHTSVDLSPTSSWPLYVSNLLNGPSPSTTYLEYVHSLLLAQIKSLERPEQHTRLAYRLNFERLPRLRRWAERLRNDPPPLLQAMNESPRWKPVFTHGDFQPQNILVNVSHTTPDRVPKISVIDWEWCGLFPPHVEWDAGLDAMVEFLSSAGRAKELFLDIMHKGGVVTPWSAPIEEWTMSKKLMRLAECVVPWWLAGYQEDNGTPSELGELIAKRDEAVREVDELLEFFETR